MTWTYYLDRNGSTEKGLWVEVLDSRIIDTGLQWKTAFGWIPALPDDALVNATTKYASQQARDVAEQPVSDKS